MMKTKLYLKATVPIFATKSGAGQAGSALILSFIFMLVILVLVSSLLDFVTQNVSATRYSVAREQAIFLAEAGVERAVSELNATAGSYSGETGIALGTGQFDVSVESLGSTLKEITATGYAPNKTSPKATRRVKVRVSINTTSVSFNYGVQVGNGGMVMDNNSSIDGNVYSNGTIDGGQGAAITGDAFSAGASGRIFDRVEIGGHAHGHKIDTNVEIGGNAYAYAIDDVQVAGDAFAYALDDCDIEGDASYTTESGCTIDGSITTPYPGEPDPDPEPFPLTDQQITDWKTAAAAGGTISGDYTVPLGTAPPPVGAKKITGNLIVDQLATLTLTGPLWVVGNITTYNNSHIKLDPAYGDNSEVVLSDGVIDVVNRTFFDRAGPNSYIMMVTTKSGDDVFKVANNVDALIVYAANGEIEVLNRAVLREVTGYKIHINELAEVTYESGLASTNFSGGPGASWQIQRGTWREIK